MATESQQPKKDSKFFFDDGNIIFRVNIGVSLTTKPLSSLEVAPGGGYPVQRS